MHKKMLCMSCNDCTGICFDWGCFSCLASIYQGVESATMVTIFCNSVSAVMFLCMFLLVCVCVGECSLFSLFSPSKNVMVTTCCFSMITVGSVLRHTHTLTRCMQLILHQYTSLGAPARNRLDPLLPSELTQFHGSCSLHQILTLSECGSRNQDSKDQAAFFWSSIVQLWWACANYCLRLLFYTDSLGSRCGLLLV